jgi:hypothetical protein
MIASVGCADPKMRWSRIIRGSSRDDADRNKPVRFHAAGVLTAPTRAILPAFCHLLNANWYNALPRKTLVDKRPSCVQM